MELEYVKNYSDYCKYWAEILAERKELKSLQNALAKANKKVETAMGRLEAAEKTAEKRERANSKSKPHFKTNRGASKPEIQVPATVPEAAKTAPQRPAPPQSNCLSTSAEVTEVFGGSDAVVPTDVIEKTAADAMETVEADAMKVARPEKDEDLADRKETQPSPDLSDKSVPAAIAEPSASPKAQAVEDAGKSGSSPVLLRKDTGLSPRLVRKDTHLDLAESAMRAAEHERDLILQQVGEKLLETQKEIHLGLRTGFYVLWYEVAHHTTSFNSRSSDPLSRHRCSRT